MAIKTFLVGAVILVKHLCVYIERYNAQMIASIDGSGISDPNKTLLKNWLAGASAACLVLRELTGY